MRKELTCLVFIRKEMTRNKVVINKKQNLKSKVVLKMNKNTLVENKI